MGRLFLVLLFSLCVGVWAQNSNPSNPATTNSKPASSQTPDSPSPSAAKSAAQRPPDLTPPRSDSINANALPDGPGESSSKDEPIDLSPPKDDAKKHSQDSEWLRDEGTSASDASELHPWDPHKAAKDVEVGDFYFKRNNYIAAESRYREALYYKDNDAEATFHLAVCLEKMHRPDEAREEYENYLKILPHGPQAEKSTKAIERLKSAEAKAVK
jgi:tetratricopeptide (TPR) repeat protein